ERTMQAYGKASETSTYALFDEAAKAGLAGEAQRDLCLSLAGDVHYHRLYHGPTRVEQRAVVVLTDVGVPDEVRLDEQTGRRIVLVDLGTGARGRAADWSRTCGTGSIERWRATPLYDDVADAFVSDVIDAFFREPGATFADVVRACGLRMMNE